MLYEYLHARVKRKADTFRDSIDDLASFRLGIVDSITRKVEDQTETAGVRNGRQEHIETMDRQENSDKPPDTIQGAKK